jgi:hypothetical protein
LIVERGDSFSNRSNFLMKIHSSWNIFHAVDWNISYNVHIKRAILKEQINEENPRENSWWMCIHSLSSFEEIERGWKSIRRSVLSLSERHFISQYDPSMTKVLQQQCAHVRHFVAILQMSSIQHLEWVHILTDVSSVKIHSWVIFLSSFSTHDDFSIDEWFRISFFYWSNIQMWTFELISWLTIALLNDEIFQRKYSILKGMTSICHGSFAYVYFVREKHQNGNALIYQNNPIRSKFRW